MKVSAINYNGIRFKSENINQSNPKEISKPEKRPLVKDTLLLAGSGIALSGIYLLNKARFPKPVVLPDEPLANSLPKDIKKILSFDKRYEEFKNYIQNPDKKRIKGIGSNSTVYAIPNMDKYVLKILKPGLSKNPNEIPIGAIPDKVNLGQPVWEHPENSRISILKKYRENLIQQKVGQI